MPTSPASSQPVRQPADVRLVSAEQVLDEMQHVFDQITARAYEIFESNGRQLGSDLQNWYRAESELLCPIQVDVFETEESFTIRTEVPGFKAEELRIGLDPHRFIIAGKRKSRRQENKRKTPNARHPRNYLFHSEHLCWEVIPANARVTLRAGVLRLELAKEATRQRALAAACAGTS
jgi:HSP20 family protein